MLDIQCPSCRKGMEFDTVTGNLICPFCLYKTHITDIDMPKYGSYQRSSYISSLAVTDNDTDTYNITDDDIYIEDTKEYIPESITDDKACMLLRKWAGKSIFTCRSFNSALKGRQIRLKYIPIHTYSANAAALLDGAVARTDDLDTAKERITRTHYYNIRRHIDIRDYHMAFSATDDISDIILENILPYDYSHSVKCDDMMSGDAAYAISISTDDIPDKAKKPVTGHMSDMLIASVKDYSSLHNYSITPYFTNSRIKTLFVPVWEFHYMKNNYDHTIYVNACTGKICGESPGSHLRVMACILIAGIILSAFFSLGILLV